MSQKYIHGYTPIESNRLNDQANCLNELLHHDTIFPTGAKVLEIGCGVGAQTVIICKQNPSIKFVSIDISENSLQAAKKRCKEANITNVEFLKADLYNMPFQEESFDFVFVCFVLEHIPDPDKALLEIKKMLKPSGICIVIEGDHGSAYYYPQSSYAQQTIECLIQLQAQSGGDSLIGRRLYPLLKAGGFSDISVSPRMVYADESRPELVDGFTLKTFTAMVEGVRDKALQQKMINEDIWIKGINDLRNTARTNGIFCYTFFKATARKV